MRETAQQQLEQLVGKEKAAHYLGIVKAIMKEEEKATQPVTTK